MTETDRPSRSRALKVVQLVCAAAATAFWVMVLFDPDPPWPLFAALWVLMMVGYAISIVRWHREGSAWPSKEPDDYR
ncbi:hypothetical protein [Conexibacter woesei]|uniref:hypothetical protein n=1 Tax=Conexibacter woesei TaxID=191495 RepID=UPI000423D304|nr:hypothetical protein [Conexibacter woesei]